MLKLDISAGTYVFQKKEINEPCNHKIINKYKIKERNELTGNQD